MLHSGLIVVPCIIKYQSCIYQVFNICWAIYGKIATFPRNMNFLWKFNLHYFCLLLVHPHVKSTLFRVLIMVPNHHAIFPKEFSSINTARYPIGLFQAGNMDKMTHLFMNSGLLWKFNLCYFICLWYSIIIRNLSSFCLTHKAFKIPYTLLCSYMSDYGSLSSSKTYKMLVQYISISGCLIGPFGPDIWSKDPLRKFHLCHFCMFMVTHLHFTSEPVL